MQWTSEGVQFQKWKMRSPLPVILPHAKTTPEAVSPVVSHLPRIPNSSSSSFSHRPISFHTASGSAGVKDTRPNKPTSTTGLNEIVDCGQSQVRWHSWTRTSETSIARNGDFSFYSLASELQLEGNYCLALLEIEILCWQNQHLLNQIQHFVNLNAACFTSKYIGEEEKFVGTFLRGKGTRLSFFFFFFLSDSLLCEWRVRTWC